MGRTGRTRRLCTSHQGPGPRKHRLGVLPLQENNFLRLNSALALSNPCMGKILSLSLNKGRAHRRKAERSLGRRRGRGFTLVQAGGWLGLRLPSLGQNGARGPRRFHNSSAMKGLSKPAMPSGFGRKLPAILLTLVPKCAGANRLFYSWGFYGTVWINWRLQNFLSSVPLREWGMRS